MSIHFKHGILPLSKRYVGFFVFIPLLLSGLTHLANPAGFPSIHTDEGHYLRRSLIFLEDHTLQEPSYRYDHPYFGQIFLSALFWLIGYPESITQNINIINAASIETLYQVPRTIMAILALVDTFLIYKISEYLYDRKIALIASLIFAVTPMTWFLNRILLDNLLLPFLLTSILFASIYARTNPNEYFAKVRHKKIIAITLSGIFLGLSIFTKLPAFTMIPAVGLLVLLNIRNSNDNKNTKRRVKFLKIMSIWIIPVIALPLMWPIHATYIDGFDTWIKDLSWQVQRDRPLVRTLETDFKVDPVLFIIGVAGLAYSALKKDFFLITWFIIPLLFFYFIGYVATFHLVLFLPIFCIAAARLLSGLRYPTVNARIQNVSLITRVGIVCLFGLASTLTLIYTVGNVNSLYFETLAFVTNQTTGKDEGGGSHQNSNILTIVGNQRYFWIPKHVFDEDQHQYLSYFARTKPLNEKLIIILDRDMERFISQTSSNDTRKQELLKSINNTETTAIFELSNNQKHLDMIDNWKFPYTSMSLNNEGTRVEVRTNY
jgi:Dolichyl-phosphate-mannose-protein mannosyltransferase